ncbi:hypothetical protein H6F67_24780 [Microcoleus sp. FACHB-1515]|uniref:hypothetical protein n=1 Tax=Cyanophyceae TaxID=3028117 RepID=UPI001683A63D|nr:hypothetical protein [Microcoleus sp. FACHB-1515]MBD2093067.1 hypothetical protein [Microcoleus sp. FACHB-1515]
MKSIELSTATKPLSAYAAEFANESIVLTMNGRAIAIVTAIKDIDRESSSLSMSSELLAINQNAREKFKAGKKMTLEEMRRKVL